MNYEHFLHLSYTVPLVLWVDLLGVLPEHWLRLPTLGCVLSLPSLITWALRLAFQLWSSISSLGVGVQFVSLPWVYVSFKVDWDYYVFMSWVQLACALVIHVCCGYLLHISWLSPWLEYLVLLSCVNGTTSVYYLLLGIPFHFDLEVGVKFS